MDALPDSPPPRPRRRWLRFSLRASMILVLLVGGVAGWVAHTIRTQREAIATVRAAGGNVSFDYQMESVGTSRGRRVYRDEPSAPKWLRRWLGDELFQSVQRVSFRAGASPAALAAVARFDRLDYFTLGDASAAGAGFRHLRGLSRLADVWVAGPGITDAMLGDLAQIRSIRALSIGRPGVRRPPGVDLTSPATDAGFAQLAALPKLNSLTIEQCPHLTDAGAARLIAGLPPLQSLNLNGGPEALVATLPALARHHPDLESLALDRTGVTDDDLKAVEALPKLRHISLQNTRIGDAGVAHFRPLKNLVELLLNNTDLTDASLPLLGDLPKLELLHFNKTRVTDAGIASLTHLPRLRQLAMGLGQITDAAMPAVGRITSLERLDLSRLPGLTDAGLIPLRNLTKLTTLTVVETQVTPEGVAALRQALPKLTRVTTKARPATPPAVPAK